MSIINIFLVFAWFSTCTVKKAIISIYLFVKLALHVLQICEE